MPKRYEIKRTPKRGRLVMMGALAAVLSGVGLTLLAFILGTEPDEIALLLLPTGMTLSGAAVGTLFLRELLARRAIQEVALELETPVLHLDDYFEFNARFTPKNDLEINSIKAALECVEKAYFRAGTRSRTYTKVVYCDEVELHRNLRARRDQEMRAGGLFHTPEDGVCSFRGTNHEINWRMRVFIDIARWPDVAEDFDLKVLPILGERVGGEHEPPEA